MFRAAERVKRVQDSEGLGLQGSGRVHKAKTTWFEDLFWRLEDVGGFSPKP